MTDVANTSTLYELFKSASNSDVTVVVRNINSFCIVYIFGIGDRKVRYIR